MATNSIAKVFLPDLINEFPEFLPSDSRSKVINYVGIEGLKQVTVNSLRAKGELRIFEIENMGSFLNFGFCEEVRQGFIDRNIHVKELTNQENQPAWTKVQKFVDGYWECRYVDPKVLQTHLEMVIYNDVVALYAYKEKHIFCVEIYNPNLATMQKQMFDFIWRYSEPLIIGSGGAARLAIKK